MEDKEFVVAANGFVDGGTECVTDCEVFDGEPAEDASGLEVACGSGNGQSRVGSLGGGIRRSFKVPVTVRDIPDDRDTNPGNREHCLDRGCQLDQQDRQKDQRKTNSPAYPLQR